ncbi:MAG: hypothetical protein QOD69_429 [Solirubrobacteraceae bacterium]|nr:hypothetical protein [Solirubrobacteraceae bacterium]
MPVRRRLSHRTGAAALVTIAALAAGASAASAGVLVATSSGCDDQPLSRTFAPWLDPAEYTALAGGDFEGDGAGWWTNGTASIAGENESFHAGGAGDTQSLALPSNSSGISPAICVGLEHPTLRFFAKRQSTGPLASLSALRVDALVEKEDGVVVPVTIGRVTAGGGWQPTLPMAIVGNLLPLLPGEHTPVAFRFTAMSGDWSIDDVWVDPYSRR